MISEAEYEYEYERKSWADGLALDWKVNLKCRNPGYIMIVQCYMSRLAHLASLFSLGISV